MLDCMSLASYTEYPTERPFINTHITTHRSTKSVKAFPESSSAGNTHTQHTHTSYVVHIKWYNVIVPT